MIHVHVHVHVCVGDHWYEYDLYLTLSQVARKLYVIGGQRNKQPLSDMMTFDLQSHETEVLANGRDTCSMCILCCDNVQCPLS